MLNHGGYCIVVLKQDSLGQRLCIVTLVLTIYENSSFSIWAVLPLFPDFLAREWHSLLIALPELISEVTFNLHLKKNPDFHYSLEETLSVFTLSCYSNVIAISRLPSFPANKDVYIQTLDASWRR